jgi:hypothetical protein
LHRFFYEEQEEMKRLLYSGLLYLVGVSVILYFKPSIMFNSDGEWKEFGLGRNPEQYTWLPFWLFTILWAILSYLIVLVLSPVSSSVNASPVSGSASLFSETTELSIPMEELEPENVSTKALSSSIKKAPANTGEMKKGYYILDANETARRGIPKYIYLGPEAPNLVFRGDQE